IDRFNAQALDLITSPKVRQAFDLSQEPDRLVERYGRGKYTYVTVKDLWDDWDPRPFVLARRPGGARVPLVSLPAGAWDTHSGFVGSIFTALKSMVPLLDRSVCALVSDLRDRGLENDVLVVVLGEFGRTPKIHSPGPGREHWAEAGCVLFAGGGLKMGQVIG